MRFLASSRFLHLGSAVTMGSKPSPPSVLRFSQPLDGLLPSMRYGLISSRSHVQASPFRVFPSPGAVSPYRRDLALLWLPRAFLPLARRCRPKLRFRALLPWRVRCVQSTVKRIVRPIPSWAFPSSRLASLRP